ncbi:hypothetical protein KAJ61_02215 [Candidatus Parcubacteria bacterium]|nr:hypothetical protein [Candidatus Parcubacteria bacterium]
MKKKALSTRRLLEDEETHLTNLDGQLENYYSAMRRAEKREEKKRRTRKKTRTIKKYRS